VLQTRESARGLIVDMPDVLFETGKYTLKSGARERLAKVAGILLAYPDFECRWKDTLTALVVTTSTRRFRGAGGYGA